MSENHHQITMEDGGRVVATADVQTDPESRALHAQLHLEAGQHRPGTAERLVDAVLARAAAERVVRLEATFSPSEAEVLKRLRERCEDVRTRAAGATVIAEGNLRDPSPVNRDRDSRKTKTDDEASAPLGPAPRRPPEGPDQAPTAGNTSATRVAETQPVPVRREEVGRTGVDVDTNVIRGYN